MTADRFDLTERVALVTGAGSGIGAGIATALAAAGARVVLVGRRADRLEIMRHAIEAGGGRADVLAWDIGAGDTAGALVDAAVQQAGFVDVLVHAAGVQVRRPALEFEVADWDLVLGIHLRAAFTLSQAVGQHLRASGREGSLLYVGSLTSQRVGLATTVAYGAAKSGLLGLMRTLAVEWAPYGIRVNTLLVGFVATEMTREIDNRPERLALTSRIPMGRLGTPEDIGGVAAFLASDLAAYVTGEAITIDGGWSGA